MKSSLGWIPAELAQLEGEGLLRERRQVETLPDGWCLIDGRRLRNFASNDYLGLTHDPRLRSAACQAMEESGCGAGASALVCGRSRWLAQLEDRLATFEQAESAVVFPSGYAANLGVVAALADARDVVFCDRLNHASLVDGCRLSGAKLQVYRHDRLEELASRLERAAGRRRLIVTDAVFSMDGDLAPLAELAEIAERTSSALIVDEAHGTGVWGQSGRGVCELLGVESRVAVRVGTLSKSVGSLGGFVAGDKPLIEWLVNRSRTQIYSTALPPAVCAAASRGLEIIAAEPERRETLGRLCRKFRDLLAQIGVEPLAGSRGPIVPLVLESPELALRIRDDLERNGFLVGAIRPPTVPRGTSRLRITLSAGHDDRAVCDLVAAIDQAWRSIRPRRC